MSVTAVRTITRYQTARCGKWSICPKLIVPLQIDLAATPPRYLLTWKGRLGGARVSGHHDLPAHGHDATISAADQAAKRGAPLAGVRGYMIGVGAPGIIGAGPMTASLRWWGVTDSQRTRPVVRGATVEDADALRQLAIDNGLFGAASRT